MNVSSVFTSPAIAFPVVARPLSSVSEAVGDSVSLAGAAPPTDAEKKRKAYKAVAWASFGTQCVGAALVLTGHGGLGIAIFAAGSAAIVYGEYKANRV